MLLLGTTSLAALLAITTVFVPKEAAEASSTTTTDTPITNEPEDTRTPLSLPRYRLSEIREHHSSTSPNPWVIYQDKVYDITDWIPAHPGGDVILRAAGQSIEPYWKIFSIHTQSAHVREILEGYLIGYVHIDDLDKATGKPPLDAIQDPFAEDPVRDKRLRRHTAKPCNAEPPNGELGDEFITPNELFYVRNHMWVPVVDREEDDDNNNNEGGRHRHTLTVELPDGEERRYTMAELKSKFPTHRVVAALQCSGNRRSDMTRHADKTNGLQWGVGAISNAEWEGVRLMDVLRDAGLKVVDVTTHTMAHPSEPFKQEEDTENRDDEKADPNTHHVQFTGLEAYAASIPLSTALDPRNDVLLAFSMNGVPLPPDHGYPLRVVVPGHVAARSVKWLSKIVVADEESTSQWQRRDYKSFGPNEKHPDWDGAPSIQEMPITSAITKVLVGDCVRECQAGWVGGKLGVAMQQKKGKEKNDSSGRQLEPVALQGYAVSGGGRDIARVDVSLDGGKTWDQADLLPDSSSSGNKAWAWKRWRYLGHLQLPATQGGEGCMEVVVKATDTSYNSQPQTHASIYNVRGNLANAWHRVRVCPECVMTTSGDAAKDLARPKGDVERDEDKGKKMGWRTGQAFGCGFEKEETVST